MDIRNGECLELMKTIPDKSVDLFLCDLPYGETCLAWDIKIDMEEFWKEFKRIRKSPKVACIHFCSTKFGYTLIKSWEKGFKMDMVWKKRNKTGGLQSRYRPMRNHEMVYFFHEESPKYNRDKYHQRIKTNPVKKEKSDGKIEEKEKRTDKQKTTIKYLEQGGHSEISKYNKCDTNFGRFEPPNPSSVLEETDIWLKDKGKNGTGWDTHKPKYGNEFEPPNPVSVVEEEEKEGPYRFACKCKGLGGKEFKENLKNDGFKMGYTPTQPASVLEEETDIYGETKEERKKRRECDCNFEPPNPASVFDSDKVFIGKRHHQTEKPQDILEFFLKYWTDEDDVVLDPTMGSGSTGVACKKLKRKFIGFELDPKIFETAKKRIET